MLHAFAHKKSRLYRRYLSRSERKESSDRATQEDEITSTILGALDLLPETEVAKFWLALAAFTPNSSLPPGEATRAEMTFWPGRGQIQPDLLVELFWGSERRLLLVELKWRSPLSGSDQLHKQWESFLTPTEREIALHLFIGIETGEGYQAKAQNDVWRGRLCLLNWHHVLYCATYSAKGGSRQFQTWAKHSAHLLGLMGITPFLGFKRIVAPEAHDLNKRVFWKGSNGIAGLVPPDIPEFGDGPVFFTNQVKE